MSQQTRNKALLFILCGEVKGVGFRRYAWRVAKTLDLKGYVRNIAGKDCVEIYLEGQEPVIEEFKNRIVMNKIYRIDHIEVLEQTYVRNYNDFIIIKCLDEEK